MNLKIKTKDIELEYSDEYSIIEESAKKRLIEILDTVFQKQSMLESSKPIQNLEYRKPDERSMRYWQDPNDIFPENGKPNWECKYCKNSQTECNGDCLKKT